VYFFLQFTTGLIGVVLRQRGKVFLHLLITNINTFTTSTSRNGWRPTIWNFCW